VSAKNLQPAVKNEKILVAKGGEREGRLLFEGGEKGGGKRVQEKKKAVLARPKFPS